MVSRSALVAWLRATILAPETAAPEGSVTSPCKVAVIFCAQAALDSWRKTTAITIFEVLLFMNVPPGWQSNYLVRMILNPSLLIVKCAWVNRRFGPGRRN